MSGALTLASFFTEWANAFGPLGIALVAIGGFILGCIALIGLETLRSKRAERLEVQSRKPKAAPNFGLLLRGGHTFSPGDPDKFAGINAGVLIWNTGDPTHIVEWRMTVSVGDVTYSGQYSEVNPDGMKDAETGRVMIRWEESFAALRAAVGEEPIACDVLFAFKAPLVDLVSPLAIWRISFRDIHSNECTAEYRPGGSISSRDWKN